MMEHLGCANPNAHPTRQSAYKKVITRIHLSRAGVPPARLVARRLTGPPIVSFNVVRYPMASPLRGPRT